MPDFSNIKGRIAGTVSNNTFNMPKHNWCRITNTSLALPITIQYYNANVASGQEVLVAGEFVAYSTADCVWDKLDIISPVGTSAKYVYQ